MVQHATVPPPTRGQWFPMTWEEFVAWDVEGKTEWVDGEGIAYVSNSTRHGRIMVFLSELIGRFVRVHGLGEVFADRLLMRLEQRPSGRMPDVLVVDHAGAARLRERWLEGPALVVVEIVSEDSVGRDMREKRAEYERAGVAEYLTVDARPGHDGVTYLRLDAAGRYQPVAPDDLGRLHSAALPGFWLDPAWFRQASLPEVDDLLLEIAPEAYEAWMLARIRARRTAGDTPS